MLKGELVELVPVTEAHVAELRRILHTPQVHERWGDADDEPGWPLEDPEVVCFAVLVDGDVRGMIQYGEEETPRRTTRRRSGATRRSASARSASCAATNAMRTAEVGTTVC